MCISLVGLFAVTSKPNTEILQILNSRTVMDKLRRSFYIEMVIFRLVVSRKTRNLKPKIEVMMLARTK